MLFLPVGLDKNEVRRTPWVTFAIIGACFLLHLALSAVESGPSRAADQRFEVLLRYLGQHPYLSPSPELRELLGDGGVRQLEELNTGWQARGGSVAPATAAAEQEELNRLTAEAFDALRSLPSNVLGFRPRRLNPLTLVTHAFVHGGWIHLLGNMLFLFLSGPFVEDLYGRALFAVLYLVSAVAGAGAFAAGAGHSGVTLVGASGAIAGVMAAFLVRLGGRRIEFLVLPIPIVPAFRFHLKFPAFVVIPLWAAEQAYYASVAGEHSAVAFSAHVGGFAAGLVFALAIKLARVEERFVNPAIERETSIEQNPAITRAADARVAGDFQAARRLLDGVLRTDAGNLDAWTERWELGIESGDAEGASQAGLRLIELHSRGSDKDMVWSVVNDARWRELPMSSRYLAVVADMLARAGDARGAIDLHRRISAGAAAADVAALRALVSEGELLARAGDARAARQAFDRARAHPACSEPWLERIERALRAAAAPR
jgi:membrane associated rhomboid family serine protease